MEPWDKVILYGTFDGLSLSSDGSRDIFVTLENGDRVDIPQYFARNASDFVEKNKIKLKDVIARIKSIDLDSQEVWLNEILNELGSDYGTLKYKAGYEQGKLEREKVTVPQFVADWIKKCKTFEHLISLSFALNPISWEENRLSDECIDWLKSTSNQETFARAWLDGYRIEKEKRYRVNVKNIRTRQGTLNRSKKSGVFIFSNPEENNLYGTKFTRKELEEAGFGGVFNSPLFEVEEVEE